MKKSLNLWNKILFRHIFDILIAGKENIRVIFCNGFHKTIVANIQVFCILVIDYTIIIL